MVAERIRAFGYSGHLGRGPELRDSAERIKFFEYMAGIIRQANDQAEPEEDIELFRQSPQTARTRFIAP